MVEATISPALTGSVDEGEIARGLPVPYRCCVTPWSRTGVVRLRYSIVYHAAIFTLVNGGVARNAIAARFQALIAITAAVRSTSSFSEKFRRASS